METASQLTSGPLPPFYAASGFLLSSMPDLSFTLRGVFAAQFIHRGTRKGRKFTANGVVALTEIWSDELFEKQISEDKMFYDETESGTTQLLVYVTMATVDP